MSLQQAFGDAQTTIACLAAGVAGATSDAISTAVVGAVAQPSQGVGAVGLEFAFRAMVSAGVFGLVHSYMPETSNNIFFSILYFATDRGLINNAISLSRAAVSAVHRTALTATKPVPRAQQPAQPPSCATGSCGGSPQ